MSSSVEEPEQQTAIEKSSQASGGKIFKGLGERINSARQRKVGRASNKTSTVLHLRDDLDYLLRVAAAFSELKHGDETRGIISPTMILLSAIELGRADERPNPLPQGFINIGQEINDLPSLDQYHAFMRQYIDYDPMVGLEFSGDDQQEILVAGRKLKPLPKFIDMSSLSSGLRSLAQQSSDFPATDFLWNVIRSDDTSKAEYRNFLTMLDALAPITKRDLCAALIRKTGRNARRKGLYAQRLTSRPIWMVQYRPSKTGTLRDRLESLPSEQWAISPFKPETLHERMQVDDLVAIWQSLDSGAFDSTIARGGIIGWGKIEKLPDLSGHDSKMHSTEQKEAISLSETTTAQFEENVAKNRSTARVTVKVLHAFPETLIGREKILELLGNEANQGWPGQFSLKQLDEDTGAIFASLFSAGPEQKTSAHLASDRPETSRDALDRATLAFSLASAVNRIYDNQVHLPDVKAADKAAFVLHIDSPWGGGKTTFANFLARMLNPTDHNEDPDEEGSLFNERIRKQRKKWSRAWQRRDWITVKFNAWEHQHITPPWWNFYTVIQQSVLSRLSCRYRENVREWGWRVCTPSFLIQLVLIVLVAVIATYFLQADWLADNENLKKILSLVLGGGAATATVGVIKKRMDAVIQMACSSNDAENIGVTDPIKRFRDHFHDLARRCGRGDFAQLGKPATETPLLIVIDDLDRCEPEYVVVLLRGLLTIFNSPYVIYVLLGDKDWIDTAFAKFHSDMEKSIAPGDVGFGARFTEKAIQMSFLLPSMGRDARDQYFQKLLIGRENRDLVQLGDTVPKHELESLALEKSAGMRQSKIEDMKQGLANKPQTAQDEAIRTINSVAVLAAATSADTEEEIRHGLMEFRHYLPDNPRRIKRFINIVSIYQSSAQITLDIMPGSKEWKQLVLWLILMNEYPGLWQLLSSNPDAVGAFWGGQTTNPPVKALQNYLDNPKCIDLLKGALLEDDEPKLTAATIRELSKVTPIR
ncbi:KAP family P-loop NTPase fold protein [Thalassospira lucentensis]|uniref:KAP NTPase domain-containing protein n=1 Tax=Thalassospira lucentensis TaxID=168935 RepID=A0A358HUQ7_9PROT|nr:P-loop NTPase fold protein [Thalassospira lucentensis]HBU98910.1 hypothetical protein [Thalassospira lucentensis]HCW67221.1 hypothetical protein [Thalassospira lucentensis]|tara:strand:- start:165 stop:3131 length:2967 start_codon:yes stop_codon:yes gene_type:complete